MSDLREQGKATSAIACSSLMTANQSCLKLSSQPFQKGNTSCKTVSIFLKASLSKGILPKTKICPPQCRWTKFFSEWFPLFSFCWPRTRLSLDLVVNEQHQVLYRNHHKSLDISRTSFSFSFLHPHYHLSHNGRSIWTVLQTSTYQRFLQRKVPQWKLRFLGYLPHLPECLKECIPIGIKI